MTAITVTEINPLDLNKALPPEFWLKVPTWNDRYRCKGLASSKTVPDTSRGQGYQKQVAQTPPFAEEFPEYMTFWRTVLNPKASDSFKPWERHRDRTLEGQPKHNYIVLCIGKAKKHFRWQPGYGNHGWEYQHESVGDRWFSHIELGYVTRDMDYNGKRKFAAEVDMDSKMANLWNRLRLQYRRSHGGELDAKAAADSAARQRAVAITRAKMAAGAHVSKLIDELELYKKQIVAGDITRDRVREILDMTNELTSLNSKLKEAMGIR